MIYIIPPGFFMPLAWTFIAYNIAVCLAYAVDKWRSNNGVWRIPESVLLALAFLFGAAGAAAGMLAFNHKTAKPLFRTMIPLALFLNIILTILLFRP